MGHVHKLVVRGLQIAGLLKRRAKQLAKYCSVSAIIGSAQYGEGAAICTLELDTTCLTVLILYPIFHMFSFGVTSPMYRHNCNSAQRD